MSNKNFICALTGHRDLPDSFDDNSLYDQLEQLLIEGCSGFLCGMAQGFDLRALECLVALKSRFRFSLEACIPYRGHDRSLPAAVREKYLSLLQYCEKQTVLFDSYFGGCFLARNRYMIEHADVLFAYRTKPTGGTAYTVSFARKMGLRIVFMQ